MMDDDELADTQVEVPRPNWERAPSSDDTSQNEDT
jgi:hypothetical protein